MDCEELVRAKIPCEETGITVKRCVCSFCSQACLVDAYIKDGEIVKVEGCKSLKGNNRGNLCIKGNALRQAIYNPERLLYPMKRVGKRGEGKFERISWDEALDTVARELLASREKYGPEATMAYVGHPKWFRPQLTMLTNAFGTPNLGTDSSTCAYARSMAYESCLGKTGKGSQPDMKNCRTLLIWGVNQMISRSNLWSKGFLENVERGMNVIVVDPRCTATTEHATIHLRPIPGTDGALALGIARVMITEGLYDADYVEKYASGFAEYRDYVMDFTPEKVEKITGVPAADMIAAARMFGSQRPSALQMSSSPVVQHLNGVQNVRAIVLLCALAGSFGMSGGIAAPGKGKPSLYGTYPGTSFYRVNCEKGLCYDEFPAWEIMNYHASQVIRMSDYLLGEGDYPIHTLLGFGMNHHMWPRPDRMEKAFAKLDFIVNSDIYMTDTCRYADILLPVVTSQEREQIQIVGKGDVTLFPPVISAPGEARTDMDIILDLAQRMNLSIGEPPMHNYEDYLRSMLTPTGLTLEELRANPDGVPTRQVIKEKSSEDILGNLKTPSGKIEFVSQVLEGCHKPGHEGLPIYRDWRETLPVEEYPLVLSTGCRKPQFYHSRTYRLPWLTAIEKYPIIELHPETAQALGMEDGEVVTLRTPVGALDMPLSFDTSCLKGMVNVYHGAGDQDINYIIDDHYYDPISGFPGFKSYCCRLEKKEG